MIQTITYIATGAVMTAFLILFALVVTACLAWTCDSLPNFEIPAIVKRTGRLLMYVGIAVFVVGWFYAMGSEYWEPRP